MEEKSCSELVVADSHKNHFGIYDDTAKLHSEKPLVHAEEFSNWFPNAPAETPVARLPAHLDFITELLNMQTSNTLGGYTS